MSAPTPISVAIAAQQLGMSERRVREICLEHNIGTTIQGIRGRLLMPADVEKIKAARGSVGNPQFGAEFGNGRGSSKAKKTVRKRPKRRGK